MDLLILQGGGGFRVLEKASPWDFHTDKQKTGFHWIAECLGASRTIMIACSCKTAIPVLISESRIAFNV